MFDTLESRVLLTGLPNIAVDPPQIRYSGAPITYTLASGPGGPYGILQLSVAPTLFNATGASNTAITGARNLTVTVRLNAAGQLDTTSGLYPGDNPAGPELSVTGGILGNPSQLLLTGNIQSFEFQDNPGTTTDVLQLRFTSTGGLLNASYGSLVGMTILMTNDASFNGDFSHAFTGAGQGVIGSTPVPPTSISGFVYNDLSNDGLKDSGEPGIPGTTLTLTGVDDKGASVSLTTLSDNDGAYSFPNLRPGTYTVTETQPSGYTDGLDAKNNIVIVASNTTDAVGPLTLAPGDNAVNNNFGELAGHSGEPPTLIYGNVYFDGNRNGTNDSEIGLDGVTINLVDSTNSIIATTITAGGGNYSFSVAHAGSYTIQEVQPTDFDDGLESLNSTVYPGTIGTDAIPVTIVHAGDQLGSYNFGEDLGSIAGVVYHDANNDGILDGSEAGIDGVTIDLYQGATFVDSVVTSGGGQYSFDLLQSGSYTLVEHQPAGYLDGQESLNSTVYPGTVGTDTITFNLPAITDAASFNFGEVLPASISGFVYLDSDNNGGDAGEPGIPTTLTLTGVNDLGQNVSLTTSSSGPGGAYSFTGLRPGTYNVTETQPAGYLEGHENPGDVITNISVGDGGSSQNNNFGEILPGSISGFVYEDANNNGADNGETGIPATLTLTGVNDLGQNITLTTASAGAAGAYSFDGLRPGTYNVTETQPAGYLEGRENPTDVISNITIGVGGASANNNFGELVPATISGFVYVDANDNGFDNSEVGIPTTLTLTGLDDLNNPVTRTTTSGGVAGAYSFTGLRPGTYTVTETQPAGYLEGKENSQDFIASITVGPGGLSTNNNFGELLPATISGFVYEDANDNGADNSETGIVTTLKLTGLDDLGNPVSITTTSNGPGGAFSFTGLRPGTYTVTETQPAAYLEGKEHPTDVIASITVGQGDSSTNNNFGEILPATISGFVYEDANNNGADNAEAGIPTTLTLTGVNDLGQNITLTTASAGAAGAYSFGNLRPGTYTVTEAQPAGYLEGKEHPTDIIASITLNEGGSSANNNFGELKPAGLSGFVYVDANNDGVMQSGEAPISGAIVTLTGTNDQGTVTFNATTNSSGAYSFGNLRPGTYTITETQPAGYSDGKDAVGTLGGTLGNDVLSTITVNEGNAGVSYNFGEINLGSLSGFVYVDANNNGIKDSGETPISGTTITLTGTSDQGAVTLTTTTNASGAYSFNNLRPGTYTVKETQPAAYFDGLDAVGSLGGTLGNDILSAITLPAGASGANYNFGEQLGSISGTKYLDITGDGLTCDDTPLCGVTIKLYKDDGDGVRDAGDTLAGTTTSAPVTGTFNFSGLQRALYYVEEVVPAGYVRTAPLTQGYYTNDMRSASGPVTVTGDNFANFHTDDCFSHISCVSYVINGCTTVTDLSGKVHQGDTVKVIFTLDATETFSLVSYTAPENYFVAEHAAQQKIFDVAGATFGPGTHSLTVVVPDCDYQIDFICGTPICTFGPAGSNVFYTPQGRLFDSDNGGTCTPCTFINNCGGTGSLAGTVFSDTNNNGVKNTGEVGIANVKVTLTGTTSSGEKVKMTLLTDASGNYKFTNLKAGNYKISESSFDDYFDGKDSVGSTGGTLTNDVISGITLASGENATGYNFADLNDCSLSGRVFKDCDKDGIVDSNELGIANVKICLTGVNDLGQTVSLVTYTDINGVFHFDDLRAGTYKLCETTPSGYVTTKDVAGTAGGSVAGDTISNIILGWGMDATSYNFGENK